MLFRKASHTLEISETFGGCGCDFNRADSLSWHSKGDGGKACVGIVLDSVNKNSVPKPQSHDDRVPYLNLMQWGLEGAGCAERQHLYLLQAVHLLKL